MAQSATMFLEDVPHCCSTFYGVHSFFVVPRACQCSCLCTRVQGIRKEYVCELYHTCLVLFRAPFWFLLMWCRYCVGLSHVHPWTQSPHGVHIVASSHSDSNCSRFAALSRHCAVVFAETIEKVWHEPKMWEEMQTRLEIGV